MTTTSFVRRYVNKLEDGQMFETLDVLCYGSRANVDFALKDLVKKGRIIRLARGIYMKGDESTPRPSPEAVATFKASSLGVAISPHESHEEDYLMKAVSDKQASNERVFFVNGAASSFQFGEYRIVLKNFSLKKLKAEQGKAFSKR